jgi:hypothetical protein
MIFKEAYEEILEAKNTIQVQIVKNSSKIQDLIHNYRTEDQQEFLRNNVFQTLKIPEKEKKKILKKIKDSGIEKTTDFESFVNIYNKKIYGPNLLPYLAGFISLQPSAKGYGKGELFCAFLNPNVVLGGNSNPFDLSLAGDEAELKEVKYKTKNGNGILYNFKFGTENAAKEVRIRQLAQNYIKQYLYFIPKNEWPADAENKLQKGELNALISLVKKYENKFKDIPLSIDVTLDNEGNIFKEGNKIGNVFTPNFRSIFNDIFANTKKLTYKDIVNATKQEFSQSDRSYIFIIGQETSMKNLGKMCYKKKLGTDIIPLDFTQGKVKIGVICNEI